MSSDAASPPTPETDRERNPAKSLTLSHESSIGSV
jgi:hypothetical protein